MTVLCNTQDGHFDIDLKEVSSLKGQLVEAGGVEPPSENASSGTSPGADGYSGRRDRPVPLAPGKPSRLEVR